MKLKKINEALQQRLVEVGLTEANDLQEGTFSTIKSGVDAIIQSSKGSGKTTTIVINVIQKLVKPFEESPRALIMVQDKPQVLEMVDLFNQLGKNNKLRVFGVHDKTDLDDDKNQISLGIDILIGTPNKLNIMFSGAGYNVNRLLMVVVDDADILLRNRLDPIIKRISDSISKTQRIFFCNEITEKIDFLAEKIMIDPVFLESDE
ncbi:DEAD/DEAH box helicase [Flavobacterium jejuense]|uniref:DEAD/DEAH box helicase n=1 Tax=Flavobacterium jejuense TaxID=1544455 RepID=A0ABX0IT87_9FLAO|nr:DEAD/DEAH box helicase [Flavobacterium jejuense]NHN25074.1 DEAD/DEAH box helicase [Flavobacterium jejuense]